METTFNLPNDISIEIKRMPNSDEFATEALRERLERYRRNESQQKRDEAFQRILNIKRRKLKRNSTDVIREEREKLDLRNKNLYE